MTTGVRMVFLVENRGFEPLTSGLQILAVVAVEVTDVRLTWEDATGVYNGPMVLVQASIPTV